MSENTEPTRRSFMAKAGAVTAALAATPLLPHLTSAGGTGIQPGVQQPKVGTPVPALKLVKPRLNISIRVPDDVDVTTNIQRVPHKHNFAANLHGVSRRATIDLTTPKAASTLRDPGSMADDDTCCCVRG